MMVINLEAPELKWPVKFCELSFCVRGRNGNRGAYGAIIGEKHPTDLAFGEAGTPSF
jgi:hypothetical protein